MFQSGAQRCVSDFYFRWVGINRQLLINIIFFKVKHKFTSYPPFSFLPRHLGQHRASFRLLSKGSQDLYQHREVSGCSRQLTRPQWQSRLSTPTLRCYTHCCRLLAPLLRHKQMPNSTPTCSMLLGSLCSI